MENKDLPVFDSTEVIEAAKVALKGELVLVEETPIGAPIEEYPPSALFPERFRNIPDQLRVETCNLDTYEIKRLNLAAALESLEKALTSQDAYPSPDSAFAVSSLSELILKLTKDIEKAQDPKKICEQIITEVLQPLIEKMVHSLGTEMKWLIQEAQGIVPQEKMHIFTNQVGEATNRYGPALSEALESSKARLFKIFNIKI